MLVSKNWSLLRVMATVAGVLAVLTVVVWALLYRAFGDQALTLLFWTRRW